MNTNIIKVISFDIGNTLIQLGDGGFCEEFCIKTGLSRETLRPLFYEHFLTKNYSLNDAVYKVCRIIGFNNPQKIIDEFKPLPSLLFEDAIPTLEQLYAIGITMVATSNCTPWEAGGLEAFGLDRYLKKVFYSYIIGAAKPDPINFQFVQKFIGVPAKNILHVGDSYIADVEGAISVGWQAVLIDRNNKSGDNENRRTKIPIIKDLRELLYIVMQHM